MLLWYLQSFESSRKTVNTTRIPRMSYICVQYFWWFSLLPYSRLITLHQQGILEKTVIFYLLSDLCNYVNWSCFKLLIVVTHVTRTVTKCIWVLCLCYAVAISACSRLYFVDQLHHPLKVTINQKGRMNTTTDALHHLQSLKTKRRWIHPQKCKYVYFRWSVCV